MTLLLIAIAAIAILLKIWPSSLPLDIAAETDWAHAEHMHANLNSSLSAASDWCACPMHDASLSVLYHAG